MTTLHIGNNRTTEMNGIMAGLEPEERLFASCASLRIVVPPSGYADPDILAEDRVADPATADAVRKVLAGRAVDKVLAFYPDAAVATLATR